MHVRSERPLLHLRASAVFATVTNALTAYHELKAVALREEIVANMACAESEKRSECATAEVLNCCLVTGSDDETRRAPQLICPSRLRKHAMLASSTFPKFESYRFVATTSNNRHSVALVTRGAPHQRATMSNCGSGNPWRYGFRACTPTGYRRPEHIPE
jgi:hypothetical protein